MSVPRVLRRLVHHRCPRALLRFIADQFHPEEFMMVMRFGNMPQDASDKSIALFAREVLPAVHEMKTLDPISYGKAA